MDCLAVFDIDGTLTDTNDVDDECFLRAVGDVLCLEPARLDWSNAQHITDSDLVRWLCQTHHGREPTDNEIRQILRTFVRLLAEEMRARPERFTPIAGARGLFDHLREQGWTIAVATGGWRESAQLKLDLLGVSASDIVLASASDAFTRVEIMGVALTRARERYGTVFGRVVSVGDGLWDVRAAAAVGWPFVGVGRHPVVLRAAGAAVVLPDLDDWDAVLAALETAALAAPAEGH